MKAEQLGKHVKELYDTGKLPIPSESDETERIAETIHALRLLTLETGTRTTRAQNHILQSLSEKELIAVARVLAFIGWEY